MNRWLFLLGLGAILSAARAELPIDLSRLDPPGDGASGVIAVPPPVRGGTGGTNGIQYSGTSATRPDPNRETTHGLVSPDRPTNDVMTLRNLDRLPGRFAGWDGPTIRWECSGARAPARIRTEGVHQIRLVPAGGASPPAAPRWVVRLAGGDLIGAEELAVDARTATLRTRAMGTLSVPRERVAGFHQNTELSAGGSRAWQNIEDWERIFNDSLGPMGGPISVYRELRLPEAALIEFDLPQRRIDDLTLRLGLGTYRTLFAESHHEVSCVGPEVRVRQFWGANGYGPASSFRPAQTPSGATHVQIAVNRAEGAMVLHLDGKIVLRALAAPGDPSAHSLVLTAGNRMDTRVREMPIRTLLVSRLSGGLQLPEPKPEEDAVRFANGDFLVGRVESLTSNSFAFVSSMGRTEAPLEWIAAATLAAKKRAAPRRRDGDVALLFADGGNVTVDLKEFGPQSLTVESDAFGRIAVERDAVRGVRFGLSAPPPQPPPVPDPNFRDFVPGTLYLRSGETLAGALVGLTGDAVRWQLPAALDPIELARAHVLLANAAIADGGPTNLPPVPPARVRLTNGDTFRAELLGLDRRQVQLRTLHTGAIGIDRARVAGLRPGVPGGDAVPAGLLESWTASPESKDLTLVRFAREFDLPPRFSLDFETGDDTVGWFAQVFLGLKKWDRNATSYHVCLQRNGVLILSHYIGDGKKFTSSPMVGETMPSLNGRRVVHATCLVDRPKNEVHVFLDGKLAAHFVGQEDQRPPDGNGIQFLLGPYPRVGIRDVVVSKWNGKVEAQDGAAPTGDVVRLYDRTWHVGPVEAIRDGRIVQTGREPVALDQVSGIEFGPATAAQVPRAAGDVRVMLVHGEQLTLSAAQLDERGLTGTSDALGPVRIAADAVRIIDFRPMDPLRGP